MMRRRGGNFLERKFPPRAPLSKNFGKKENGYQVFENPKNFFQKVFWWGLGQSPNFPSSKKRQPRY
jgi:hypothetical protein